MSRSVVGVLTLMLPLWASAQSVYTENEGQFHLYSYDCQRTESGSLKEICYDGNEAILILLLDDAYYAYCDVPGSEAAALLAAPSKDEYFDRSIKGRYDC